VAASTVVRWVKVLVALVAVGLMLFGVVAILVGLLGRLSTGTGGLVPDGPAPTASVAAGDPVKVVSVPDGDTIVVRVGEGTERVRVIGLDTPEIGSEECFAVEAAREARALVQGRTVLLSADPTQDDRDRYGRVLRHVTMADGRSMAQVLIAGGFGREYTYDRPYAGRAEHRSAQAAARQGRLGIWGPACATGSGTT
jgi:micrococcal nuclease